MNRQNPNLGKYILDSLSIGMYNHPFLVLREYVQNCTDAIDELKKIACLNQSEGSICVKVNGRTKCLSVEDNGIGVPAEQSWHTLHDVGKSQKKVSSNRGFRGIGRLGGLGYCKELEFITKATGETVYSHSRWDCERLRELIREENELNTTDIISEITQFHQKTYEGSREDHFFVVKLINLQSSRDLLLNVPLIKEYLSQVGPVPFKKESFGYADSIDLELRSSVPSYETYNIYVNGEQIFKPYQDAVVLRGKHKDRINDVQFFELSTNGNKLAIAWLAELDLLGTISNSTHFDGIRVRSGNILIGDKLLLSSFFREKRFNNYLAGEIHVIDERLIPNSRRDDFEDNPVRDDLYDSFIRIIGLPYSKKIRHVSMERSKQGRITKDNNLLDRAERIIEKGYYSISQKNSLINNLDQLLKDKNVEKTDFISLLIDEVKSSVHYLDRNGIKFSEDIKWLLKNVFEIIHDKSLNKYEAEKLISEIIDRVDQV